MHATQVCSIMSHRGLFNSNQHLSLLCVCQTPNSVPGRQDRISVDSEPETILLIGRDNKPAGRSIATGFSDPHGQALAVGEDVDVVVR